jgi:hypothetical protein
MMNNPLAIFRLKREERLPALLSLLYFAGLNALWIHHNFEPFTRCGKLGYWTLFSRHFLLSGFDPQTYVMLSQWRQLYELERHPLLAVMLYPFAALNDWLMDVTGMNCAVFIVATVLTLLFTYAFVFMLRILRDAMQLRYADALLLDVLLFACAYMMLTSIAPDHFGISFFLLVCFLYLCAMSIRGRWHMPTWVSAAFAVVVTGVTVTNGVKVVLGHLFCVGRRRFFRLRTLLLVCVVPAVVIGLSYAVVYETIEKPEQERQDRNFKARMKKDPKFVEQVRKHEAEARERHKDAMGNNSTLVWTDMAISRPRTVVDNLFGESLVFHEKHVLEDANRGRPVFVTYDTAADHVAVGLLLVMFVWGMIVGRRDRLVQLCVSWFAFDMLMHLVLGFAISEIYIMTAHWAFLIPIFMACLFRGQQGWRLMALRAVVGVLTLFLLIHNGRVLLGHLL